jgi:hypothetical protein
MDFTYYRVGDDVLEIIRDGFPHTDECHVGHLLRSAFTR